MSHFSVAILTNEGQNPEDLLEPYSESIEVAPYQNMNMEIAKKKRAERIEEYGNILSMPESKQKDYNMEHVRKEFKRLNAITDEEYLKENLYEDADKKRGYSLSRHNPSSKWDWYELGGRWAGTLVTKVGITPDRGSPSLLMKDFSYKDREADQALVKDVDFEEMRRRNEDERRKSYRDWKAKLEAARDENERRNTMFLYNLKHEELSMTEDEWVRSRGISFQTYAFITPDGVWHEKGEMGWFGMASNEKPDEYAKEFEAFISSMKPEQTLSIYDCHI